MHLDFFESRYCCSYKDSVTLGTHPDLSAVKSRAASVLRIRKSGVCIVYTEVAFLGFTLTIVLTATLKQGLLKQAQTFIIPYLHQIMDVLQIVNLKRFWP